MIKIKIDGFDDIQRKLNKLDDKTSKKIVKDAIKTAMKEIVLPEVIARSPIDTGALTASETVYPNNKGGKVGFKIAAGGGENGKAPHAIFVEYGTEHMPAQPFMRPALDATADEAIKVAGKEIMDGIDDEVK